MKIAIIGCPGSGKSTLASQLHTILGISLFHLDQYFWKPGWQRPDRDEFKKVHDALCDKNEWIIEGMAVRLFEYRVKQADVIVFLDIPLRVCLYRIFKRALLNFGKVIFSSAPGCPERLPDWEFLKYVLNFNKIYKPEVKKLLQDYKGQKKIFIIKNNVDAAELIKKIELKNI
jgi:adenylate kinase family enzyme